MPDSEEVFQIVGEVRWVRVYNEHSDTSPGLGIRFKRFARLAQKPRSIAS